MRKTFTYNGKRYDITAHTKRELDNKYFYRRLELEFPTKCKRYLVSEWGDIWLERYKKPVVNDKNYKLYKGKLNNLIYPYIGDKDLTEVTSSDCQILINQYCSYSDTYLKKIVSVLKSMFSAAVNEGLLPHSPAENIIKPKGIKMKKRRSLTSAERDLVVQTISASSHGLYFALMLYCGLRPHECGLLQGKDVVGNRLHIRGTKSDNADRWVIIPKILSFPKVKPDEYFFPNMTNQKRDRWWKAFKRQMNIIGGCEVYRNQVIPPYVVSDDLTPYCLRHTFCTDLETAGVPINIARQLMGHSTIELTSRIYTHTSGEAWKMVENNINNFHMKS